MSESLFNKAAGLKDCNHIKKGLQRKFSCEIGNIFINTYCEEHSQTIAPKNGCFAETVKENTHVGLLFK